MTRPLDALTGFRFLAAAHVLVLHETVDWIPDASDWVNTLLRRTAAVSFFFVLSGFILVQAYGGSKWRSPRALAFAIGRLGRLYPLYLLGLLLYAPFFLGKYAGETGYILKTWFVHVFLLQSWFPELACTWNCPGWSVSATVFFAVVFPLLCYAMRGLAKPWLWGIMAAAFIVSQFGAWSYTQTDMGYYTTEVFYKNPLVRLPEFIIGVSFGFLWRQGALRHAWIQRRPAFAVIGTVTLGLFLLLPGAWSPYLHNGLLTPLFVLLIAASVQRQGRTGAFLRHPSVQYLGRVSFAVYILHIPVARILARSAETITGIYPRWTPGFVIVDLLLITILAGPVYKWIEEPARKWMRRTFGPRPAATA